MIKQNLSITIAANFQSDSISFSSSIAFSLFVMNLISFSIDFSSLLAEVQLLLRLAWLELIWFMSALGLELFSGWNPFSLMKPPPDDKALKHVKWDQKNIWTDWENWIRLLMQGFIFQQIIWHQGATIKTWNCVQYIINKNKLCRIVLTSS